jgi:hypothetical protein
MRLSAGKTSRSFAWHPRDPAPSKPPAICSRRAKTRRGRVRYKLKLTMFYLAGRGPSITAEGFPARWMQHLALFESLDLERAPFTSNKYLLIERGPDFEPIVKCGFVGISIMTLDDLEAVRRFGEKYRDAIGKMKVDEVETFGADIDLTTCFGDRRVLVDGPRTDFALILLRQRKVGVGDSEFHAIWIDHVKRILAVVGGGTYPSHVAHTRITHCATPAVGYSGMTEFWFNTMEEAHACRTAMEDADLPLAEATWSIPARSVTIPVTLVK